MSTSTDNAGCAARSWRMAAYGGVVVAILLMVFGGSGLVASVIAGVVVFGVGGFAMSRFLCPEAAAKDAPSVAPVAAPAAAPDPAPVEPDAPTAAVDVADEAPTTAPAEPSAVSEPIAETQSEAEDAPTSASPMVKPSKSLPGQEELASRKGTWRFEGNNSTA